MALTQDELRAREAARLENLVAQLMAAIRTGNSGDLDRALDSLVDFRSRTPFSELQTQAARAHSAATGTVARTALEELADIAEQASAAGAGFKAAAMIAEDGKKELLFPTLAATAARGLEIFKQFQDAIEAVKKNIQDVSELGDIPEAVDGVLNALNSLKEELEAVQHSD